MTTVQRRTPIVDDNEQCPHCKRWFKEGHPLQWHIRTTHGPEAAHYQKIFTENIRAQQRRRIEQHATRPVTRPGIFCQDNDTDTAA